MTIRLFAFSLLLLAGALWHRPAEASGDFGCAPSWQLVHRDLSGCDNTAMLAPGNDTRVNLLMLLLDLRGKPIETAPTGGPTRILSPNGLSSAPTSCRVPWLRRLSQRFRGYVVFLVNE